MSDPRINADGTLPMWRDSDGRPQPTAASDSILDGGPGGVHDHDADYAAVDHGHTHDHDETYAAVHSHPYAADDHGHEGGDHPNLASHETLGLVTDTDLSTHAATAHGTTAHAISGVSHTGTLDHSALGSVTANQHHNQAHAIGGADHTGSLTAADVGAAAAVHDHDAAYSDIAHTHTLADGDIPAGIARDSEVTSAVSTHEGAANPHPGYLTPTEGDAAYSAVAHDHDSDYAATSHSHLDADIPAGIARDAEVTAAIATHAATPHGGGEGGGEAFPVGSVFMAVVSTDPATLLGYGTWSAFGAGRMLVGLDSGDAAFDTVEETGGAKTHSHSFTQPDAHTEVITHTHDTDSTGAHVHDEYNNSATTGPNVGWGAQDTSTNTASLTGYDTGSAGAHTHTAAAPAGAVASIAHAGGAVADGSTLPPYIVVYMWKRTA